MTTDQLNKLKKAFALVQAAFGISHDFGRQTAKGQLLYNKAKQINKFLETVNEKSDKSRIVSQLETYISELKNISEHPEDKPKFTGKIYFENGECLMHNSLRNESEADYKERIKNYTQSDFYSKISLHLNNYLTSSQ